MHADKHSRWSFGGNKLQLKAEVSLIADVLAALQAVSVLGSRPTRSMQALGRKQELLVLLLQSETTRLNVWLAPLQNESGGYLGGSSNKITNEVSVTNAM